MAMVDNIYSYKEAMSKIEYLEKHTDVLKGTPSKSHNLDSEKERLAHKTKNYESEDSMAKNNIKQFESELGLQLEESESKVANLKDHMRETKGTFKKNQMQAEEFVSKLRDEKKNAKQEAMKIRKKELQNHQKVL
jgi:hypothetical protein